MVVVHEFGHFFTAKKFGIRVDEFGFGFPPKLFSRKYGETEYSFNLLPLGGFVKIFGENPDDENTNGPDRERSFVHKAKWKQAIVLFAGVLANFILGWILVSSLYMVGTHLIFDPEIIKTYPTSTNLTIDAVSPDGPADKAHLIVGDIITGVVITDTNDNLSDLSPDALIQFIRNSNGHPLSINILRKGVPLVITVTPTQETKAGYYMIGINPSLDGYIRLPFFASLVQGFKSSIFIVNGTVSGLSDLITRKVGLEAVSGPIGMIKMVDQASQIGFSALILFTALISFSLAVINLFPIPALDGGRLLFLLIEKIKGSRINPKVANTANVIGFGALMLLMVVITFHDILVKWF